MLSRNLRFLQSLRRWAGTTQVFVRASLPSEGCPRARSCVRYAALESHDAAPCTCFFPPSAPGGSELIARSQGGDDGPATRRRDHGPAGRVTTDERHRKGAHRRPRADGSARRRVRAVVELGLSGGANRTRPQRPLHVAHAARRWCGVGFCHAGHARQGRLATGSRRASQRSGRYPAARGSVRSALLGRRAGC